MAAPTRALASSEQRSGGHGARPPALAAQHRPFHACHNGHSAQIATPSTPPFSALQDSDSEASTTQGHAVAAGQRAAQALAPSAPQASPAWARAGRAHGGPHGPQRAPKRLQRAKPAIQGITKPAIRRLARRGGVARVSSLVYEEARDALAEFLRGVIRGALTSAAHARRDAVTAFDVVHALKLKGRALCGCGA